MQNKKQGRVLLIQIYIGFDLHFETKHTTMNSNKLSGPFKFLSESLKQSQGALLWKIHGVQTPEGLLAFMLVDAGHQQLAESMLTAKLVCTLEYNGILPNLLKQDWSIGITKVKQN